MVAILVRALALMKESKIVASISKRSLIMNCGAKSSSGAGCSCETYVQSGPGAGVLGSDRCCFPDTWVEDPWPGPPEIHEGRHKAFVEGKAGGKADFPLSCWSG